MSSKARSRTFVGWTLIVIGLGIAALNQQIVFPGFERLLGIETIVGRESVVYRPNGDYIFTNPGAMIRWTSSVAAVGILIASVGACVLIRARRHRE